MSGRRAAYLRLAAALAGGAALGAGSGIAFARFAPGSDDQSAVVASVLLSPLAALLAAGWVGAAARAGAAAGRMGIALAVASLLAASRWIAA